MTTEETESGDDRTESVEEKVEDVEETVEEKVEDVEEEAESRFGDVEERAEDFLGSVDENVDRLLSEILDTRARVAVYVGLRKAEGGTPEAVAEETGIYPDTVERVLEDLEEDDIVEKEEGGEGGSTEYAAVSPTELVRRVPDRVGEWISDLIGSGGDERDEEERTDIEIEQ